MNDRRPHPWLYEHDHDARLVCEKCIHYEDGCGRAGWICGGFRLNEEHQMTMEIGE